MRVVLPLQSRGRYSWICPSQTHGIHIVTRSIEAIQASKVGNSYPLGEAKNPLQRYVLGQYGDPGEDVSINMDRFSENFRVNTQKEILV